MHLGEPVPLGKIWVRMYSEAKLNLNEKEGAEYFQYLPYGQSQRKRWNANNYQEDNVLGIWKKWVGKLEELECGEGGEFG